MAPPAFGCPVAAYLNQRYEYRSTDRRGPITCPPRFSNLTQLGLFFIRLMKEVIYRTKVSTIQEMLRRIIDCAAYKKKTSRNGHGNKVLFGTSKSMHLKPWRTNLTVKYVSK
jgi:hypothetical protein